MKKLRYLDYYILIPYLVLCAVGVVMVYSASAYWIKMQYGMNETAMMWRQLLWVGLGLLLVAVFYWFRLAVMQRPKAQMVMWVVVFFMLIYLAALSHLKPGAAINGATAWIKLGPLTIQPTEFAKLAVIFYLAFILTKRQKRQVSEQIDWSLLKSPLWMVGLCTLLVLLQPDTGGAGILIFIVAVMIVASGISIKYFLALSAGLAGIVGGGYWLLSLVTLPDWLLQRFYQLRRLVAAVHPFAMRKLEGNQVVNSLVAIGHGGVFGQGLGNSSQKLGYLPEPYTDFILAIITEELGLIGALLIVGLLFFLILRIYLIGVRTKNTYHALIAYGIGTLMLVQSTFNIGAVVGLLPVTGVTLPFISYGGSSMLVLSVAIGIMLNISANVTMQKITKVGHNHA